MQSDSGQPPIMTPRGGSVEQGRRGFTILETLVVISIITLLLAILMPAIGSVRGKMLALKCSSNMRTIAFKFQLFAEGENPEGRGDSEQRGGNSFYINDFQESLYRIDEFWDARGASASLLSTDSELMLCPAGPVELTKRQGFPCSRKAIQPLENITLGINMRLQRATINIQGMPILAPAAATRVKTSILSHPYVPLAMDVDGSLAVARGLEPFYTAPPLSEVDDAYADGRYWMPSARHGGYTNVAFVGGHVLQSTEPARESWDWEYQTGVGR